MAIIYSYPLNQNILATDIIVGTTTAVVNGRPKNQTKSFEVVDLATFINAGNTLDSVLNNGNTSFLDAKVGSLGLYDITDQDYAKVSINDSEYNFYNASNTLISVLTNNSLVLYPGSYTGQLLVPNTITANRIYTFPNQSGTVALTSDIPYLTGYVPYTGATGPVNLGLYNLTVNEVSVGRGSSTANNSNVVVGSNSSGASLNGSTANSFFGSNSGNVTITGNYNTFLGQATGYTNTGSFNTAVGSNAFQNNTSGNYNSAFGLGSNRGNTTGIGNITVGTYSAYSNTIGNYNSHLGYGTGYYVTSGNNNVFFGLYAGRLLASGNNNTISNSSIFIGANSASSINDQVNQIVIGDSAVGAGSNTVTIGNTSITTTRLRGNVQGGAFVKDGGTSTQFLMADGTTTTAIKTTYMMTGVFTNMFGGDPGGLNKDVLDWVGSSPAASHSSALPILQNCKITAAGFKWISSTPPSIGAGQSWTVNVYKLNNPLTDSTTADTNYTFVGALNITLTNADNGVTVGKFSSGLNLVLNAGDIIRIAGDETGAIATTTEEAQLTVLFEVI